MIAQHLESVIILGSTLSGLVAANDLARRGYRVTLVEHPAWALNRLPPAYLFGCHHHTWALLRSLPPGKTPFDDHPLPLEFRLPGGPIVSYSPASLPGSFHWIAGLVRFRGLSWQDRWQLLSYLERVWEQEASIPTTLEQRTADAWLASIDQSQTAREAIWSPLAQFLTSNPLTDLSAATFAHSVAQPFLSHSSATRLTLLDGSLHDRLMTPLSKTLTQAGVTVLPQQDLPLVQFERNAVGHVRLCDGRTLHATWYLAALPPRNLLALLPDRLLTRYAYFSHLGELQSRHEIAVEIGGPRQGRAPRLLLLSKTSFHRLSIAPTESDHSTYTFAATVDDSFASQTDQDLFRLATQDLHNVFPTIPSTSLHPTTVQRNEQAILSLKPGVAMSRPIQCSLIHNLLVAGGWTDTGWPDNIESAVVSARQCIEIITGSVR